MLNEIRTPLCTIGRKYPSQYMWFWRGRSNNNNITLTSDIVSPNTPLNVQSALTLLYSRISKISTCWFQWPNGRDKAHGYKRNGSFYEFYYRKALYYQKINLQNVELESLFIRWGNDAGIRTSRFNLCYLISNCAQFTYSFASWLFYVSFGILDYILGAELSILSSTVPFPCTFATTTTPAPYPNGQVPLNFKSLPCHQVWKALTVAILNLPSWLGTSRRVCRFRPRTCYFLFSLLPTSVR